MISNDLDLKLVGRRLPIGTEDFKKLITEEKYYIDKTLLMRDLKTKGGEINLFLRPRRFGKTLALSMLKYFYEDTGNPELNAENRALFDGLEIAGAPEEFRADMTSYPVISLTLKSAKQNSYDNAVDMLRLQIVEEVNRHYNVIKDIDDPAARELIEFYYSQSLLDIKNEEGKIRLKNIETYKNSLAFLSKCLFKVFGKKAIILIDEYDVPLESAYFRGYYGEMIDFIRTFFESGLKTNPNIEFAVITGCLRVSKESLFTGFNNPRINTMASADFGEFFGFTEAEVDQALIDFEHPELSDEMRRWYNGYRFGKQKIYNPWSVINCLADIRADDPIPFKSNWANTSSNDIIKTLIENADKKVRDEVEILTNGGTIEKRIHEDVTYAEMLDSDDNLFNFLYFTGYLTTDSIAQTGKYQTAKLIIPNDEIMTIYEQHIMSWFGGEIKKKDFSGLYKAIEEGDCAAIENVLKTELSATISYNDYDERYYHGFLTGILLANGSKTVRSNRESGLGRYDIALLPENWKETVIIIEVKSAKKPKDIEIKFREAEEQIRSRSYAAEFENDGFEKFKVYAAVFFKKSAEIRLVIPPP